MDERTEAEQTWELFHMDCGLCVFTVKPVLLTAFEKNSEADRQIIGLIRKPNCRYDIFNHGI